MGSGDGYFHEYPVFPKKNRKLIPPINEFYVKAVHHHNEWLISVPTGRLPGGFRWAAWANRWFLCERSANIVAATCFDCAKA